jgi:hypothetical protein
MINFDKIRAWLKTTSIKTSEEPPPEYFDGPEQEVCDRCGEPLEIWTDRYRPNKSVKYPWLCVECGEEQTEWDKS